MHDEHIALSRRGLLTAAAAGGVGLAAIATAGGALAATDQAAPLATPAVPVSRILRIRSAHFPNVYLRADGSGITSFSSSGGGVVNCQYGAGAWEQWRADRQPDGTFGLLSVQWPNRYLRLDGRGITAPRGSGGGVVNLQIGVGAWEKFRIEWQEDGTYAIASVQFPGVYVRADGTGVTRFLGSGGGVVNAQYGVGAWEKFYLD